MPKLLFTLSSLFALAPWLSQAAEPSDRCYTFTSRNLPYHEARPLPRTEHWCYRALPGGQGTFIYNADSDRVRPELSMVKRANGTLTHGSLMGGQVSMHSVQADVFNPFSIPLEEPVRLAASAPPATAEFAASEMNVMTMLLLAESPRPETLAVRPGSLTAETAAMPWRGYWWPNKNHTMSGPMTKYDAFSRAHGVASNVTSWESSHHVSHGLWWEGHCNGWAAAAILRAEPRAPVTDSASGITFSVSDQKGILTEADYCANAAMFGVRNDGGGDPSDMRPEVFHRTLTYYVGTLHKPIAMDYRRDAVVDNHVISGYRLNIQQSSPGVLKVTATLRMHQYDGSRIERPGVAPTYTRVYRYSLFQDASGRITGGQWISENPDFMWVPLSTGRCSRGQAALREDMIANILR